MSKAREDLGYNRRKTNSGHYTRKGYGSRLIRYMLDMLNLVDHNPGDGTWSEGAIYRSHEEFGHLPTCTPENCRPPKTDEEIEVDNGTTDPG